MTPEMTPFCLGAGLAFVATFVLWVRATAERWSLQDEVARLDRLVEETARERDGYRHLLDELGPFMEEQLDTLWKLADSPEFYAEWRSGADSEEITKTNAMGWKLVNKREA